MPNSARVIRGIPDNTYRVVRNLHSTVLNHGDCVQYLLGTDTPPTGYSFSLPTPAGSLPAIPGVDVKLSNLAGTNALYPAGIVFLSPNIQAVGIGQGQYFTILVSGYHPAVKTTVAALAAGTIITADSNGKVVGGAVGDDPISRIGVCLRTGGTGAGTSSGTANIAGCEIRCQ